MNKAIEPQPTSEEAPFLILSDGKPGHLNQSIAFARLLDRPYEIMDVGLRNRIYKPLSYLFDLLGISASWLLNITGDIPECSAVISTGSETYYANRVLSQKLGVKSVTTMLPRGRRREPAVVITAIGFVATRASSPASNTRCSARGA